MAKNPVYHSRTRHIALKHHFIREAIDEGVIQLEFCKSEDQMADIFTKALLKVKFQKFREEFGVQRHHIKGENIDMLLDDVDLAKLTYFHCFLNGTLRLGTTGLIIRPRE
ncbi:hypothetical protein RJ640_000835 [Escallonia rubra]|uniref:Retrovirus-related Pol polyprotein from transposon TNT 1-94 n=1 Tax=Escallonia rubra TaxID=112253 RepID=A0AA88QYY0_9ASTE|nr:hypothetical protein RJ640_000835 [Escallonia rubra]